MDITKVAWYEFSPAPSLDYPYKLGKLPLPMSIIHPNRRLTSTDASFDSCAALGAAEDPAVGPSNNEKLRSSVMAEDRGNASIAEKIVRLLRLL